MPLILLYLNGFILVKLLTDIRFLPPISSNNCSYKLLLSVISTFWAWTSMESVSFSCLRHARRSMLFASLRSNGKVAEFAFLYFPLGCIRDEPQVWRFSQGFSLSTSGVRPESGGDVWAWPNSGAVEKWDVIRYTHDN